MDCGNRPECSEIADRAVKKTFAILGVDIDNPKDVEEFRADLRFGKRMRKIADHSVMAFVSVVIVALAGALWIGITNKIRGE